MGFYKAGMRHLTNTQRAVEGPQDIEGLKIRTPRATYYLKTLERMGADATPMAFNEIYTAMEQGVVDGQENPLSDIDNAALYEVNDHLTLMGHPHLAPMVPYSEDLYEDLSPQHEEIVR